VPPGPSSRFQRVVKPLLGKRVWVRAKETSDISFISGSFEPSLGYADTFFERQDIEGMGQVAEIDERLIEGVVGGDLDGTT